VFSQKGGPVSINVPGHAPGKGAIGTKSRLGDLGNQEATTPHRGAPETAFWGKGEEKPADQEMLEVNIGKKPNVSGRSGKRRALNSITCRRATIHFLRVFSKTIYPKGGYAKFNTSKKGGVLKWTFLGRALVREETFSRR